MSVVQFIITNQKGRYMLAPIPSNVNPQDYEQVTFVRKRRKVRVPMYRMISISGQYRVNDYNNETSMGKDFLTLLLDLSSQAQKAFKLLHNSYDATTGISVIPAFSNNSEKVLFSRGFKELQKTAMVKRVKRQHYIINPKMYINPSVYGSLCQLWDSLP